MGFAICRFNQDERCTNTGSRHWYVQLPDLNMVINVPSMWKHYMTTHLVQPTAEERIVVMAADPLKATGQLFLTLGKATPPVMTVLYVERVGYKTYTHQIGTKPDTEFIGKLEKILEHIQPLQTKGLGSKFDYI